MNFDSEGYEGYEKSQAYSEEDFIDELDWEGCMEEDALEDGLEECEVEDGLQESEVEDCQEKSLEAQMAAEEAATFGQDFLFQEEMMQQMLPEEILLVQQAREIVRRQEQQEADHFMEKEFLALQKAFPDCGLTEVGELLHTEAGKKALQLWKSVDIPLADAYAATHRTELQARQNAAVRQGILNQMNGKRHLTQTRSGGERIEMPAQIRAEFKRYFPDASNKEIERMYRKNQQQK